MFASLRHRRAVFWHLGPDRIVAAVLSRTDREPLLEACAASYAAPVADSSFAAGVTEVAWVLGCRGEPHVAALAAVFCRVEAAEAAAGFGSAAASPLGGAAPGRRRSAAAEAGVRAGGIQTTIVKDADGLVVRVERSLVAAAADLFRRSRLPLVALDCEPCALETLAAALGAADKEAARRQHLAAVSVAPEAEKTVEALGDDLAVPVGLAVGWFGAGRAD